MREGCGFGEHIGGSSFGVMPNTLYEWARGTRCAAMDIKHKSNGIRLF
jgi:hypothetical protein